MMEQRVLVRSGDLGWNISNSASDWEYANLYHESKNELFRGPYALLCRSEAEVEYGPNVSNKTIEYYQLEGELTLFLNREQPIHLKSGDYLRVPARTEIGLKADSKMSVFVSAHGQVIWFEDILNRIEANNIHKHDAQMLCRDPWLPFLRNRIYSENCEPKDGIKSNLCKYLNQQIEKGNNISSWELQLAINLVRSLRDDYITMMIEGVIRNPHCSLDIRLVSLFHLMNVKEDFFSDTLWADQKSILEQSALPVLTSNCRYYVADDFYGLKKKIESRLDSQEESHQRQRGYYEFVLSLIKKYINEDKGK